MNIDQAFPSKWLRAEDLAEFENETTIVTIVAVKMEKVGQDGEKKPVVYFEETDKGLVMNPTNKNLLKQVLGTAETDDWRGRKIYIYATEVQVGNDMKPAIRVKTKAVKEAAKAASTQVSGFRRPAAIETDEDEGIPI